MLTANTLFWRELPYVAKYAFVVLFFWLKICVCAICYAFSISGSEVLNRSYGCSKSEDFEILSPLPKIRGVTKKQHSVNIEF